MFEFIKPGPRSWGQIKLPEVVKGRGWAGTASEHKHGVGGRVVDRTMGISLPNIPCKEIIHVL